MDDFVTGIWELIQYSKQTGWFPIIISTIIFIALGVFGALEDIIQGLVNWNNARKEKAKTDPYIRACRGFHQIMYEILVAAFLVFIGYIIIFIT